jgi:hypothetical protein
LRGASTLGGDLRGRYGATAVAPGVQSVGECVGDFLVRELDHRRHHRIELCAVDEHFALQAVHDDADGAILVAEQEIGARQRRECSRDALAVGLMACHADRLEDLLAGLDLCWRGARTGDFSLVHLRCRRARGSLLRRCRAAGQNRCTANRKQPGVAGAKSGSSCHEGLLDLGRLATARTVAPWSGL